MEADGSVVFQIVADDKQAQTELNRLQKNIQKLNTSLSDQKGRKSLLAEQLQQARAEVDKTADKVAELKKQLEDLKSVDALKGGKEDVYGLRAASDPEAFIKAYEQQESIKAELKEQEHLLETQTATAEKLGKQYEKAANDVSSISGQLEAAETEAGKYAAQLSQIPVTMQQADTQTDKTSKEMERLGNTGNEAAQKITKGFHGAGSGIAKFGKRLVGLAKRVFVFSMITMALRNVRKWLLSMINTNAEASAALAQLKGAFLTLAQPLLNVLIPALTKVIQVITQIVTAIASLVASLFGTTVQAAAAAAENLYNEQNALEGVGGAAKKASKQLANFDEINQLTGDNAGGGGGGTSAIKPNFQIDDGLIGQVQGFLDRTGIGKALEDLFTAIGKLKKGLEEFWNSTAGQVVKLVLKETFITAIKLLADALSVLAAVLSGDLWSALDSLQKMSWDAIFGVLKIFAGIIDLIFNPEGSLGVSAIDAVTKAEEFINKLPKVSEAAKIAKDNLGKVFEPFTKKVKALYYLLQSEWYYVKWWYIRNVKEKLEAIWQPIQDAWDTLIKWLRGDGTAEAAETGETLGEAFANSLKEAFIAVAIIINGIIGSIETALNMLISKINSLSIDIPNKPIYGAFAGEHVGFNIPPVSIPRITIPGLAEGAVIPPNREFLAVLGDQTRGTNIEAPLDTIVAAFRRVMSEQGNGRQTIVLELDRRELGRAVADVSRLENQRVGLKIGGSYA